MKTFYLSYKGRDWNEDFAYSCDKFAFVLDGATGLSGEKYTDYDSDAQWYSHSIGNYLVKNLGNTDKDIFSILKTEVKALKKEYEKLTNGKEIEFFPSATLSLARVNGEDVEFYTLSDSLIIVEDKFGNIFQIYDSRNNINDNIRFSCAAEMVKQENKPVLELREKYNAIVGEGKKLRNTTGHQYILADDVNAVDEGICFSMPMRLIKKVMILTDGFSQCFDLFKFVTMEKFVKAINNEKDAIKFYKKLIKLQDKDSACKKYFRFKKTDDASIACMIFD